jgi:hypothetical protein
MKRKISIWRFEHGNQGGCRREKSVMLNVKRIKLTMPVINGCCSLVLEKRVLPIVEYEGERRVVERSRAHGRTIRLPEAP